MPQTGQIRGLNVSLACDTPPRWGCTHGGRVGITERPLAVLDAAGVFWSLPDPSRAFYECYVKLPWREAGPPNHLGDKVAPDQ